MNTLRQLEQLTNPNNAAAAPPKGIVNPALAPPRGIVNPALAPANGINNAAAAPAIGKGLAAAVADQFAAAKTSPWGSFLAEITGAMDIAKTAHDAAADGKVDPAEWDAIFGKATKGGSLSLTDIEAMFTGLLGMRDNGALDPTQHDALKRALEQELIARYGGGANQGLSKFAQLYIDHLNGGGAGLLKQLAGLGGDGAGALKQLAGLAGGGAGVLQQLAGLSGGAAGLLPGLGGGGAGLANQLNGQLPAGVTTGMLKQLAALGGAGAAVAPPGAGAQALGAGAPAPGGAPVNAQLATALAALGIAGQVPNVNNAPGAHA